MKSMIAKATFAFALSFVLFQADSANANKGEAIREHAKAVRSCLQELKQTVISAETASLQCHSDVDATIAEAESLGIVIEPAVIDDLRAGCSSLLYTQSEIVSDTQDCTQSVRDYIKDDLNL